MTVSSLGKTPGVHEIKFDGYRTQLIKDEDGIRLMTKSGYDWTGRYIQLAGEAAAIKAQTFIIDGEAIMINEGGCPTFTPCNQP